VTRQTVHISQLITCQDTGVYMLFCRKTTGPCARLAPTYVGITGEGEENSFTHRFAQHLGSATQPGQVDTTKPVGRHFRLPGHEPNRDMVMLPIERVRGDVFLRRARERFNILKFDTEKRLSVYELEHGLNLDE
jgi:hypothetical protein